MSMPLSELLLAESPDAIVACKKDGRVLLWNRGAERMFGFTSAEAEGHTMCELIVPEDRVAETQRIDRELLASGYVTYESMRRRKDGSRLFVDVSGRVIGGTDWGDLVVYTKKDVTALKVLRDAKLMQARFGELLDSTPDGILLVNATGRVVLANRHAEALFGYAKGELVGMPIEMLLPQRFRQAHVEHRAGYVGQPRVRAMGAGLDLYGLRKNGAEFPVEISLSPLQTEEGTLIFSAIRDTSERKQIERALRETNTKLERASAAKDRFLAGMSHELRTPLNAIIGFTGTLLMRLAGPLTEDQEKQLRTVQGSARHLLALINDLLDLAKIEAGKMDVQFETFDVVLLLNEVVAALRPQAERKDLQIRLNAGGPRLIHSDQRILRQILINFVDNAIKYTDQGGVVLDVADIVHKGHPALALRVTDTGIGISAEDQARLFGAFTQLHAETRPYNEGTGLGLHLSRRLAELIEADIMVESEPGKGSRFTIVIGH